MCFVKEFCQTGDGADAQIQIDIPCIMFIHMDAIHLYNPDRKKIHKLDMNNTDGIEMSHYFSQHLFIPTQYSYL